MTRQRGPLVGLLPPVPTVGEVLVRLAASGELGEAGGIADERLLHRLPAPTMPWFVRLLAGFGAWVAALLITLSLALGELITTEKGQTITGLVLVAVTVGLRHTAPRRSEFLDQLTLALCLAGQLLAIFGVGQVADSTIVAALVTVVLEALLAVVYPDQVQRFVSGLAGGLALGVLLDELEQPGLLEAWSADLTVLLLAGAAATAWWLPEPPEAGWLGGDRRAVGYGLIGALTLSLMPLLGLGEGAGAVATVGLAVAVAWLGGAVLLRLRRRPGAGSFAGVVMGTALLAVATFPVPGILAALGFALLGFAVRDRLLVVVSLLFLAVFTSWFYYDLELTLLAKSGILVASGLVLLGLRAGVLRRGDDR